MAAETSADLAAAAVAAASVEVAAADLAAAAAVASVEVAAADLAVAAEAASAEDAETILNDQQIEKVPFDIRQTVLFVASAHGAA